MSASPAGNTPGRTPNGAGGPLLRRPPKPTSVLVQKKKPQRPRQPVPGGQRPGASSSAKPPPPRPAPPRNLADMPYGDRTPSLFAQPPPDGNYKDYPVVVTKKELMENMRIHVARFGSRKPIDLLDEKQFVAPLYLLRRDVRTPMPGTKEWEEMRAEQDRRTQETAGTAERDLAKEAAKAEIAPSMQRKKPKTMKKKKKDEAMTRGQTKEQKERSQIKYEEALPWHLEDYEQKQIWTGTYEGASSNIWSQLRFEQDKGRYVMTPLQKWYKFGPKTRFDPEMMKMMEEQRVKQEKLDNASPEPGFWAAFSKAEDKERQRAMDEKLALNAGGKGLYRGKTVNEDARVARGNEDELDFEEDWADDEAPPAIEGEADDVKAIEARLRKDQLKANFFENKTLREYQEEEELEKFEEKLRQKQGRKLQKALYKRERNALYEVGKKNRYSDESDSTDTEEEMERERQKKEAEAKAKAAAENEAKIKTEPGIKTESGSRTGTPSGRPSKHPQAMHKGAASLKRPGSPNLSDASGNESSVARKKAKLKNPTSKLATMPSRTSSPAPSANGSITGQASRPPPPSARASFAAGAGSGSDTETGSKRRLKLTSPRSPNGSPGPSRIPSRAGSPAAPGTPAAAPPGPAKREFPRTTEELRRLIPEAGITMKDLMDTFNIGKAERVKAKEHMAMVKMVATFDRVTKLLMPKKQDAE